MIQLILYKNKAEWLGFLFL